MTRIFSSQECLLLLASKDRYKAFTHTRCQNWKTGTETGKRLNKHSASKSHIQAISLWVERQAREKSCCSADLALSRDVASLNRYYLSARAGAQAILDGWSQSQKNLNGGAGAGARNLSSGSQPCFHLLLMT